MKVHNKAYINRRDNRIVSEQIIKVKYHYLIQHMSVPQSYMNQSTM